MARFILHLLYFFAFFSLAIVGGIFLPATPRASTAHLFAKSDKDSLLKNSPSPRIILIGGSNISMSINSKLLMDSFGYFPVNTGLSASMGLMYMLDNSLQYIKPGDVVVLSPEYSQFYGRLEIGTEDLVRVILDNNPADIFRLRKAQLFNIIQYIPKYALGKYKITDYLIRADTFHVYRRKSFNEYGDMDKHWPLTRRAFLPLDFVESDSFNESVLVHLCDYRRLVKQKGAHFYITFPAVDEKSFDNQNKIMEEVRARLVDSGFIILGTPVRYKMPDRYMFDTPYHLTQPGVDYRTNLLIEDLKHVIFDGVEQQHTVEIRSSKSREIGTALDDNGLMP